MSEWIEALRKEAKRTSQGAVGTMIGYSSTAVNQVLKGTYKGDLRRIEDAVRGAIMGATVDCPVVGDEIPRHRCIEYQRRSSNFAATNPMRVQLHRTCPTCKNRSDR